MLEPDVTLTDLVLAGQTAVFAILLLGRRTENARVNRTFAELFVALSAAALLGGIWHGFLSGGNSLLGIWIWFATMTALAIAGAALWCIAALLLHAGPWSGRLRSLAVGQLIVQTFVSAFVTDAFWVAAVGMLPPTCLLAAIYFRDYWTTRVSRILVGFLGLVLAVLSGLVIVWRMSLVPLGLTPNALYHVFQILACWLVFHSIPAIRSYPR